MKKLGIFKKFLIAIVGAMVVFFSLTPVCIAKKVFLTLGTSSPGGVYYPMGGGMAVVIEKSTGYRCAAEATAGSIENCRLLGNGDLDMAMAMGSVAFKATNALEPFKKKYDIVTLFQMYTAPEHVVAVAGSGIESMEDLRGKRVSIDVPGSGTGVMAEIILESYGFDINKDIKIARLTQSEIAGAMRDNIIDAFFMNCAYPAATLLDLASRKGLSLIPVKPTRIDKILAKHPYFIKTTVPAGIYRGVNKETLCLGDSNLMLVNRRMSDEVAYKIVKAIFENSTKGDWALNKIHPIANQIVPANGVNSPLELHPGAIKYFKEVGALK